MPDDILDAAQKAINAAAGLPQQPAGPSVTPPQDQPVPSPVPETSAFPEEPAPVPPIGVGVESGVQPTAPTPSNTVDMPKTNPEPAISAPLADLPTQHPTPSAATDLSPISLGEGDKNAEAPAGASQLVESILDTNTQTMVVPPVPSKPKSIPRKKSISGAVIAVIALLLLALPVGVYYISQQNQQLADVRSRATGNGPYCGDGSCNAGESNNACPGDCSATDPNSLATGCRSGNSAMCTQLCGSQPSAIQNTCVPAGVGCGTAGGTACTDWHWTNCIGGGINGVGCGTGGGCTGNNCGSNPTATPPPPTNTPPVVVHECKNLKIMKGGVQITPSTLLPGDDVVLVVRGNGSPTKARFRINGGAWQVSTTAGSGAGEYKMDYSVPASGVTDFVMESEVFVDGAWK